jgi:hypothetical protein
MLQIYVSLTSIKGRVYSIYFIWHQLIFFDSEEVITIVSMLYGDQVFFLDKFNISLEGYSMIKF